MRTSCARRLITAAAAAVAALTLVGCTGTGASREPEPLIVFAAASLQAPFDALAIAFESTHPTFPVAPIRYDGSQALAAQIIDGVDVDVIAFASEPSIQAVLDAGRASRSELFAANTLQIAVVPGNPKGIDDLADLAEPDISVVLCAREVPCGDATQTLLGRAGLSVVPVSEETSVSAVTAQIRAGEADAGLVYATDVHAADGALTGITPSGADAVINRYPIAVAEGARSPDAASAFVDFVLSPIGREILAEHGFAAP